MLKRHSVLAGDSCYSLIQGWSTQASAIVGASDGIECDNFSKHSSLESHLVSNTPGYYGPTALITGDDTSRKPLQIQYPYLDDGIGGIYAAGPPFDVCNADPSNLATGSALHYNFNNFMPQSVGAEVHLAKFAFHAAPTASTQSEFTCSCCGKAFKRKGDLTRHGKSHGLTKFYCLYGNCPRRVYAKGFHRKDKLVQHLEFSHKMTNEDAKDWATSATIACKW